MEKADKNYWEDLRWGEIHHGDLLKDYRDQWVAIENKEVVAAGTDLTTVTEKARKRTGKEWVPLLFIDCGRHILCPELISSSKPFLIQNYFSRLFD